MSKFVSAMIFCARQLQNQLGRCPRCMHSSFLSAAAGVLLAFMSSAVGFPAYVVLLTAAIATLLTGLWMAHALMFTVRSAKATARHSGLADRVAWSRRRLLGAFLRVLAFSAVTAALPGALRAQSCNCYTENGCSCPPDFPQCIFNPTTGEAICCGPSAVGCAGPNSTWCCPPGTNCYGTDNQCY
jgi:hypothetical protein